MPDDASDSEFARLAKLGVRGLRMMSASRGSHVPHLIRRPRRARTSTAGISSSTRMAPISSITPTRCSRCPTRSCSTTSPAFLRMAASISRRCRTVLRMLDSGRVWLKLSGPMRCTTEEPPYPVGDRRSRARFVKHAPERLVWGTDWPHVNMNGRTMPNDGDLLDQIGEWVPDESGAQPHSGPQRQDSVRICLICRRAAAKPTAVAAPRPRPCGSRPSSGSGRRAAASAGCSRAD